MSSNIKRGRRTEDVTKSIDHNTQVPGERFTDVEISLQGHSHHTVHTQDANAGILTASVVHSCVRNIISHTLLILGPEVDEVDDLRS